MPHNHPNGDQSDYTVPGSLRQTGNENVDLVIANGHIRKPPTSRNDERY